MFRAKIWTSLALVLLLNAIPLWGVVFEGWSLFMLIFFYWLETLVSGVFTYFKISRAEGVEEYGPVKNRSKAETMRSFLLFSGTFFCFASIALLFFLWPGKEGLAPLWSFSFIIAALVMALEYLLSYRAFIGNEEYRTTSPYEAQGSTFARILLLFLLAWFGGMLGGFGLKGVLLTAFVAMKAAGDMLGLYLKHIAARAKQA